MPEQLEPKNLTIYNLFEISTNELNRILGDFPKKYYKDQVGRRRSFGLKKIENEAIEFRVEVLGTYYESRGTFSFLIEKNGNVVLLEDRLAYRGVALYFFLECLEAAPLSVGESIIQTLRRCFPKLRESTDAIEIERIILSHRALDILLESSRSTYDLLNIENLLDFGHYAYGESYEFSRKIHNNPSLNKIFLAFSNGRSIGLSDFMDHPYSVLFSKEREQIFTWVLDPTADKSLRGLAWDDDQDRFWLKPSENNLFFSIIQEFLKTRPVFLGRFHDSVHSPSLEGAVDFQIKEILPLEDYRSAEVILCRTLEPGQARIALRGNEYPETFEHIDDMVYDASQAKIYVPQVKSTLSTLTKKLGLEYHVQSVDRSDDGSKHILVKGHPHPQALIKILKNFKIKCKKNEYLEKDLEFDTVVRLDPENSGAVEISPRVNVGGIQYQVQSKSDIFRRILAAFTSGMAIFFDSESTNLASRSNQFRSNELKLYKHGGLVRFLSMEVANLMRSTEDQNLTPRLVKSHLKDLDTKVATFVHYLFSKEKGVHVESLDQIQDVFVSKKCVSHLRKFIASFFVAFQENDYFLDGETVLKVSTGVMNRSIFNLIVETLTQRYTPKELLRGRSNDIRVALTDGQYPFYKLEVGDESVFDFQFDNRIRFQQAAQLGTLMVGDQQIENLSSEDLAARVAIQDQKERDWFELHPKYFFRGKEISSAKALKFSQGEVVEFQGNFYRVDPKAVPSMRSLERFWARISETRKWGTRVSGNQLDFEMERSKVLDLLALKKQGVEVSGGEGWKKISHTFENLESSQKQIEKSMKRSLRNFGTELRAFQLEGLRWMMSLAELGLGCLLADDMGLGKTVQTVALLHCSKRGAQPHLIVVPTSLVHNWAAEIQRFSKGLSVVSFEGSDKPKYVAEWGEGAPDICLTTYGLMVQHEEFFQERSWSMCIFDEAQNLKNVKAKRRKVAAGVNATHKIALTGTPLENHYGELYSLVDICVPGALGPFPDFMATFGGILKGADDGNSLEDLQFLKKKIGPLVLRRTKDLVLDDLPKKTETVVAIPFDKKQAEVYKKMALAWNQQISGLVSLRGESGAQLEMLTALLKLRQICSLPQSVEGVGPEVTSPKFDLLISKLTELDSRGESAIVFTNFLSTLEELRRVLERAGLKTLRICGKDSKKNRQKTLETFNSAVLPHHLIMTLKSGGVGLNLTRANYVFHFEPWWNPAAENQGTDRVHRIGQDKGVQVYRYIMKDSVEEKIQDLKRSKQRAFDLLFEEDPENLKSALSLKTSKLTQSDFEALLS